MFKYLTIAVIGLSLGVSQIVWAQTAETFEVSQQVRNLTKQNVAWTNSVEADAGDRIEFQVIIVWRGEQPTQNVLVREILAEKLVYAGNLKLNSASIAGDIVDEAINIGLLANGETKTISFEAQVVRAGLLDAGTSRLVNTVTVFNTDGGSSVTSLVTVDKPGIPTDVATGLLSVWMVPFILLLAVVFVITYIFFFKYYVTHEILATKYENRTHRKLATLIDGIQEREKRE